MSIRKRRWVTNGEPREAWVLDYVDQYGKRRQKSFRTQTDAKAEYKKILAEISSGIHVADGETVTVAEAADAWINRCESENLDESTLKAYRGILKYNIVPLIGNRKLNKITTHDVIKFQDELKETPYPKNHTNKRSRSVRRSRDAVRRSAMLLGAIIADAQVRGKASHNPVYDIPRKVRPYRKTDRERLAQKPLLGIDIPTPDEVKLILKHVCGGYWLLLIIAIFCGLRSSELRGLRWMDIDFKQGVLHVRQRADAKCQLGPPKSKAGYRSVPIPPSALEQLRQWKTQCPDGVLDLVFPSKRGTVAHHGNIIKTSLCPTMERAGLMVDKGKVDKHGNKVLSPKYGGLHALRHWFASWCINRVEDGGLGLSMKQVQERMGHSGIQITMDTYSHLFPVANESDALGRAESLLLSDKNAT